MVGCGQALQLAWPGTAAGRGQALQLCDILRDLKSSNILMRDTSGDCVIADLGLALQLVPTDDPSEISNHGQARHKPHPLRVM